ncbi:trichohyalin-like [Physella acuta]|uniref:trichohyalin-like n=1 Tax=Physella acuta TaxID=109671 RepID=UPI0027DD5873|nr:trichohyalin-like [Physella acuta]
MMSVNMLSSLSRGYGPWNGSFNTLPNQDILPSLDQNSCQHRHGVTPRPSTSATLSTVSVANDGHLDLPKTYLTRKGALMLFTSNEDIPLEPPPVPTLKRKRHKNRDLIDLSLKLRTLERLSMSVLQFGDKSYDKETASISDQNTSLFFNFLHDLSQENEFNDAHSQPGEELKFYLKDLKRRASYRGYGGQDGSFHRARSAELQEILDELEKVWPHSTNVHRGDVTSIDGDDFFFATPTPSTSRSLSRHRVLSSKKLTGSLKSLTYMGRPVTADGLRDIGASYRGNSGLEHGRPRSALTQAWSEGAPAKQRRPKTSQSLSRVDSLKAELTRQAMQSPEDDGDTTHFTRVDQPRVSLWSLGAHLVSWSSVKCSMYKFFCSLSDHVLPAHLPTLGSLSSGGQAWGDQSEQDASETPHREQSAMEEDEREAMLAEAASVLSSLAEEGDIDVPNDDSTEWDDDQLEDDQWPEEEQQGHLVISMLVGVVETKHLITPHSSELDPATGPLHPPYSGVLDGSAVEERKEIEELHDTHSRGSFGTPVPSSRGTTPSVRHSNAEHSLEQVLYTKTELDRMQAGANIATESDVSVQHSKEAERAAKLAALDYLLAPSSQSKPPESTTTEAAPATQEESDEDVIEKPEPLAPKRRERPADVTIPKVEEEEGEKKEEDVGRNEEPVTSYSERVKQEREEKERKSAKLREEKEKAEAKKREEEELRRLEKEDKAKAAEERLRMKAEEAAKRKEEEKRRAQEDAPAGKTPDIVLKPTPPPGRKESPSRSKGGKSVKKVPTRDSKAANKQFVKALDVSSAQQDGAAVTSSAKPAADQPNQVRRGRVTAVKKEPEVPGHLMEMLSRKSASQTELEMEEEILKMKNAVDNALAGSVVQVDGEEGLTEEDFKAAQEALMEKIKRAEEGIQEPTKQAGKKGTLSKVKPELKPRLGKAKKQQETAKRDLVKEREAIKERERLEKERRLEEVRALQQKIIMKEEARKAKEAEAKRKAEELKERMEALREEEAELERAEQDAREQIEAVRKAQRAEREARRKAELERKKEEAIKKREKEKAMAEAARLKEKEMLDSIADAEMARRLREEDEARREEEEMVAQERFEAALLEAQKAAEEEEEKLRELERQAEEEAFQRLLDEKEEAETRRRELENQARQMREDEERIQREMLEEEKRLETERRRHEEAEEARREQERARLRELQRLEEEAREKMRGELEKRRAWALQRREHNLRTRSYMDSIKQAQGITEPWTFSYFVRWPKETYMRSMGTDPKKIKGPQKPRAKIIIEEPGGPGTQPVDLVSVNY